MAPNLNKTNFKSYEASTRLLAALVTSIQGQVKLNFNEIQKLFGESTAGGIEWQFRDIKALGKAQQQAIEDGKNPADVKPGAAGTPGKGKASASSTPATAKKTRAVSSTAAKRKRGGKKVVMSEEDSGEDDAESNYEAKDVHSNDDEPQVTPTPKRRRLSPKGKVAVGSAPRSKVIRDTTSKIKDDTARSSFSQGPSEKYNSPNGLFLNRAANDEPASKTSACSSRIKKESRPESEENILAVERADSDLLFGDKGMTGESDDQLSDGEV
ncbi:hypothetical protein F4804DRAFT_338536 [Jackrogersella minutella]|nr:hypothetical protein F4804DRAFT_338536 [Jackrogersella minutella]